MEIDKKRRTIVFFIQKSIKTVVLSCKINGTRCILYQQQPLGYGRPQTSQQKRQAKTLLLQNRCTPIALPAPRPELLISGVPPLCLIFDPKPIIPLRTSPEKSKTRQAKTSL